MKIFISKCFLSNVFLNIFIVKSVPEHEKGWEPLVYLIKLKTFVRFYH